MPDLHTLVIGGGIAGLAAATEAIELGDVAVLEARPSLGGVLRSERSDGYLCEGAAASILLPAAGTSTLIATTGAAQHVVAASAEAKQRWIHYPEGLLEVPMSPSDLFGSRIISPWAKLGALVEAVTPALGSDREESVSDFIARRFGTEIAKRLAQPVVAGVYAGQASRLSVDAAFAQLRELEREGGVLRGGLRRMRRSRAAGAPRASLASFDDGMETLPRVVGEYLGPGRVQLEAQVVSVRRERDGWRIATAGRESSARRLVLACGPGAAAELLGDLDAALAAELGSIPRAPVAVVNLGVDAETLDGFAGFGFLAHPMGGLRLLGAVFDSIVFPGRAPEGRALVRVLVGGSLNPERVELSDTELVELVCDDLGRALVRGVVPKFARILRNRVGIPQYEIGHRDRMREIDARVRQIGDLALVGWAYRGIGVNSNVNDAFTQVRALGS